MLSKIYGFLAKAKNFLKNKKIYLAAVILILQALYGYLGEASELNSLADFIAWFGGIGSNEFTARLLEGLGLFGLRFAYGAKQENKKAAEEK